MLQISIDGPKHDDEEGIIFTIDIRRVWKDNDPIFQKSLKVLASNYDEALEAAVDYVKQNLLGK
jgi:hypothetical protein